MLEEMFPRQLTLLFVTWFIVCHEASEVQVAQGALWVTEMFPCKLLISGGH
jgi:hypothetical protein